MDYRIEKYGAVGDGCTNDCKSIQSAIDACSANGGGRVVMGGGKTYYSSSIELKAHVDLHLEKGVVLKAHSDMATYYRPDTSYDLAETVRVGNPVTGKPSYAFIHANGADHISVSGEGTIDGNAYAFVKRVSPYYVTGEVYPRPTLIYTENCNHATFRDIVLQNAPFWTLHPAGSDDVRITGVRILNDLDVANSDGIDPDHCTNVRITDCHIVCADDCICLKNTNGNRGYHPTKNVVISGCTLISTSAGIKIGTEGVGDFENIIVDNCIITGSNRGLSIQIRDGGNVRNTRFSNLIIETRRFADDWWGCGEPIVITAHDRDDITDCGIVECVQFANITCDSENGILLSGMNGKSLRNISLENVFVRLHKKSKWPIGQYDLRPIPGEESHLIFKSPGLVCRYVDGLWLDRVRCEIPEKYKGIFSDDWVFEGVEHMTRNHCLTPKELL